MKLKLSSLMVVLGAIVSFVGFEDSANAYLAAIRLGYPNCTSCHYNPSGGMTLTPYGRALSRELISTYGEEGEEGFLWGATESIRPKWLQLGGDLRISHVQKAQAPEKSVSRMTVADLEAIVGNDKTRVTFDYGFMENPNGVNGVGKPEFTHKALSRRFYFENYFSDYFSVRAGKFSPNFGLWNADASNSVRAGLGMGDLAETINIEANYIAEDVNFSMTGVLGSDSISTNKNEQGVYFSASRAIETTYKLGVSGFYRKNDQVERSALGGFSLLGFSPRLYFYNELYLQDVGSKQEGSRSLGLYGFNRLGYEFLLKQAFFILISNDFSIRNLEDKNSRKEYYSVGFQWMPRPHLEFQAHWRKARDLSIGPSFGDEFVLNFHLYQ